MKIVTWKVKFNSRRLEILTDWLQEQHPEVVLLQEIKCEDHTFPCEAIEDLGYNIAIHGQKTFNWGGYFIQISFGRIQKGLSFFKEDVQARYIEAVIHGIRVASVYVPNGQTLGCDKYAYKLIFLERLYQHLQALLPYEEAFIIGGDYNIAPTD